MMHPLPDCLTVRWTGWVNPPSRLNIILSLPTTVFLLVRLRWLTSPVSQVSHHTHRTLHIPHGRTHMPKEMETSHAVCVDLVL